MQAERLVTVVILTNQFGSQFVKSLQSIPKNWPILICSPSNGLPKSIDRLHPRIHHWQMMDEMIQDFAQSRNLALQQVKTKWAFFLDSDEVIEGFNQQQFEALLLNPLNAGLTIARSDVFYGQKLRHGEVGQQSLARLVRVDRSHFAGKVHEVAVVDGQVISSNLAISHFSHDSISQFISQVSRYANMSIELHQSKSKLRLLIELLIYPPLKFLLNFIVKLGFLDGWRGLVYALIMSLHSTLVRLMTLEQVVRHAKQTSNGAITLNFFQGLIGNVVSTSSASTMDIRHPGLDPGYSNSGITKRFEMLNQVQHDGMGNIPMDADVFQTNFSKSKTQQIRLGLSFGLLILLPFGQLLRWSITDTVVIYPHDLILSLLALLFTINIFRSKSKTIWQKHKPWQWEITIWGYFWLLGVIKLLIANDPNQFLIISRLGVYALGLLIAIKSLNRCRLMVHNQHLSAQQSWVTGLGLFAWLSFVLYLVFPDMRSLAFFGWDDHYYRLIGTLFDPNYTGLVLSVGLLSPFGWLSFKRQASSSIDQWMLTILSLFFAICLGLTFSRSSWLSLSIAVVAYFLIIFLRRHSINQNSNPCHHELTSNSEVTLNLIQGRRGQSNMTISGSSKSGVSKEQRKTSFFWREIVYIIVTSLVVIATVIFALKPGGEGVDLNRSASVNSRLAFDQYILQSFTTSDWIFGKIADQLFDELTQLAKTNQPTTIYDRSINKSVDFHPKTANNLFVTSLLWGGIIGLALLIILFGKWFWVLYQNSPVALSILIAWLVHAQFNNSFLEPFVFLFVGGSILSLLTGKKVQ